MTGFIYLCFILLNLTVFPNQAARVGDCIVVLFEGRNPLCNGIVIEPHWIVVPAHCIGQRRIEDLNIGYGSEDLTQMSHNYIFYAVLSSTTNADFRDDYALLRLIHELPIEKSQLPRINFLRVPYRAHFQIAGYNLKETNTISMQQVKMRNYECETARENTQITELLLCFQVKGKTDLVDDGAMIFGYDKGSTSQWQFYGMHVKYTNLTSWYMRVGRAINFAAEFWYWLYAAKFERALQHIPANKRFYCCDAATLDPVKGGKQIYKDRREANVQSDGKPPLC